MKYSAMFALLSLVAVSGCQETDGVTPAASTPEAVAGAEAQKAAMAAAASENVPPAVATETSPAESTPAGSETSANTVALTEANTKVEFVGVHVGEPDPRKGSFSKLTGTAVLEAGALKSVAVEFDTNSLTTDIPKLTDHLKSIDFFDVNQHPTARFESTAVTIDDGTTTITGNLTLLGITKPITFPATVSTEDGLKATAEFSIDRTEFGMTYGEDKVEKDVAITVSIGS